MRTVLIAVLAIGLLASGDASWAQPPKPAAKDDNTTVSGVTVTAPKVIDIPKTYRRAVEKFVHSDLPEGNVIRWTEPICPYVSGLSPEFNAFIRQRFLDIAAEVGAPKPRRGSCQRQNVLLVFAAQQQEALDGLRKKHPDIAPSFKFSPASARSLPRVYFLMRVAVIHGSWGTGRIRNGHAREIVAAFAIVDPSQLEGQPIGRIADFMIERMMRTPRAQFACASLPTIRDAFDPRCPASNTLEEMTAYDKAFLRGLYRSDPEIAGTFSEADIQDELLRTTRPPTADDPNQPAASQASLSIGKAATAETPSPATIP